MTNTQVAATITRLRKLIAEFAGGLSQNDAAAVVVKINAATLKLDRAGWTAIANEYQAKKTAANATGRGAPSTALAAERARLREEHREELRASHMAWMGK